MNNGNLIRKILISVIIVLAAAVAVVAFLFLRSDSSAGGAAKNTETAEGSDTSDSGASEDPETALVHEIILSVADSNIDSDEISLMLDELGGINSDSAQILSNIIAYWDVVNINGFVNDENLPEGLADDNSFCIAVLGYSLNDDGTIKDELVGRLETALCCAEAYPNAYVLVTGGGTAKLNKSVTEADLMAEWLIAAGLDESRIIIENRSLSTAQNAIFSSEILISEYPQISSVAIVTSDYHVPLGCLLFNEVFLLSETNVRVVSNASYKTKGKTPFSADSQAEWVRVVYDSLR